ncbi:MAG: HlyD family efflux transporter periplasmic adaptor subunit [Xanthomonadales bacterium]|nr:HlyD family efflux transporter periplasmic adaptor subunit [Xanthomonadales bacterium]
MKLYPQVLIILLSACLSSSLLAADDTILISGEIAADQSQKIIAPMSANWNLRLDWMAEEGSWLNQGDIAVRFDNSANDNQIIQTEERRQRTRSEGARTSARLEKEEQLARFDAEIAKIREQLASNEARIQADFIGELNYADNQLALTRAQQAREKAEADAVDRLQKLKEARLKTSLDQSMAENDKLWFQKLTDGNLIKAEMDGFILYKRHPWNRSKFRAGDNVQTSFYVAEIVDTRNMYVRLFINAVDRAHLELESPVKIYLDAHPDKEFSGKITEMLAQGESRKEWGKGLYMQGRVVFDSDQDLPELMPGMSVLVELVL